jgi:DNA replication protein DnaC
MMETDLLLKTLLKSLRLPTFIDNYAKFAQDAANANLSYERFLLALAEQEVARRDQNRQKRLIKNARFPVPKEFADFDFSHVPDLNKQKLLSLAETASYIHNAEPIFLVGNPGLGKTHLATALGLTACRQGYKVRFYNTAALVNDLIQAQDEHRFQKFLASALKHRLFILDELGFIPFTSTGAHLIFQFCSALYERVAIIVTTNLPFTDWTRVFGDERLTGALLDRLTHRSHIFEFVGESHRFRQRMQQKEATP